MSASSVPSARKRTLANAAWSAALLTGSIGVRHVPVAGAGWTRMALDLMATVLAVAAGALALRMLSRGRFDEQTRTNESLTGEMAGCREVELETRIAAARQELAEQDHLAALSSRIALALTTGDPFPETLRRSAEIIVESLDAAFVRIWTLNKEQDVLELRASAGMYTHLNGPHGRVPVGRFKIGRIAEERKPHLTNTVQEDSWVSNQEWARREGMVAFAGYPLMVGDRLEGVIAAFARHPLTDATIQALGSIAGSLALFIGRHRIENALLESEERVRLLLDSTAEGICGMDLQGRCTLANRAGVRIFGYQTEADLLGRNLHDLSHHTRADGRPYPASECELARAIMTGEAAHGDDELFWRADGSSFPAEYWAYPVVKDGKVVAGVISFLDVSARKQAEEEQRKLVSLVESSDDFVVIASPEGRVQYLNQGGAKMIGLDRPQEAIGHHISSLHTEAAWAQLENTIPIQVATGLYKCETEVRHWKTGAPIDVLLSAFVLRKPETGELLCLAAVMRDNTGRKRAEQALRTSEERFRIATESAGDMTIEHDLKTQYVEVFGRFGDRLGDRPAPRNFEAWKSMVHPEDIGPLLEEIGRHIESGERYVGEYRVLGQKGDIYHYSLRGQAIRNAAGEASKWIAVVTDITEHKKAEQALAQLAAIVQSSEDAIIGASLSGIVTSWNGGAEKLLGYDAAEAIGAPISILLSQPGRASEILDPSVRGKVSRFDETVLVCKSLETLPVSLTVSPIRNGSGAVTGVAAIARDIRARKQAETELAYQAQHDHLTGLPNRLLVSDRLAASIARAECGGRMTAVLYLDLDGFKLVNDTLGHETGDGLLRQVTERLRTCIREPDTLARMGGDEFMLVISEVGDDKTALAVAERLQASLRQPFTIADHELYLTASIGISMYPRDGADVSALRQNADAAMYQAKHAGKDRVAFFTPAMRATVLERLELETDLRHALDRGELFLQYQPIFEATGGRQTAFEALVRWKHPTQGMIAPNKFIPVAEETGLIMRLGAWVLKEACRECHEWQRWGLDSVRVAVNVSPLEFARAEFAAGVLSVLDETR
ncbi:MAG TPA: PAS domain S-box protein, partial [Bryobacteraceae bacterium]|nr:PAS domain S-box protein [Bryobacteraceae bacterium]